MRLHIKIMVVITVLIFFFASVAFFSPYIENTQNNKSRTVSHAQYPPDFRIIVNKTFFIPNPGTYKNKNWYYQNITEYTIGTSVNFTNYWFSYNSSCSGLAIIKSLNYSNSSEAHNYFVICLDNGNPNQTRGSFIVYGKHTGYTPVPRGTWEIEIEMPSSGSVHLLICNYGGFCSFNPHNH